MNPAVLLAAILLTGTASLAEAQPAPAPAPAPAPMTAAPPFDIAKARAQIDSLTDRHYPALETLYRDIHAHAEVAFQEQRTAALLAGRMRKLGFTVTEHVGKTGVVALYKNGDGPVVLVRTELDALPMEEKTGLPFASRSRQTIEGRESFIAHSCGHDVHMSWWLGAAEALVALKAQWRGTLMFVAQPAEETVSGAKAMLADPAFAAFPKADYAFAAHVGPMPSGMVYIKDGGVLAASDTLSLTFHGRGAHGSMPHKSIDPVMMGAHFANDVQTVVSREKEPDTFGVLTIGAFNAGTVANIIPDEAVLKLSLRSHDEDTRKLLLGGVERTAKAVSAAAAAPPPTIERVSASPLLVNDGPLTARLYGVLKEGFGKDVVFSPRSAPPGSGSEDFPEFVQSGIPSVYVVIGALDPAVIARSKAQGVPLPVPHSPFFAPDFGPAVRRGIEVLSLAVMTVATRAPGASR